jgi:hypothetical protein
VSETTGYDDFCMKKGHSLSYAGFLYILKGSVRLADELLV